MKMAFTIFILLFSGVTYAEPQALIISGGRDRIYNFPRYYSVSKLAWETESARGLSPVIVEGDGDWDFAQAGPHFPAHGKADVEKAIELAASKLKPGESLTIFVNDHGEAPRSIEDPLSARIVLYGGVASLNPPEISARELMEMIKRLVPSESSVKLVGIQCYAGSLHSIAFALPNVCSAAGTDFRTLETSTKEINLYGQGFWNEVKSMGHVSLLSAHWAGAIADTENENRAELSSMAYVEWVLKKRAYDGKDAWGFGKIFYGVSEGPPGPSFPILSEIDPFAIHPEVVLQKVAEIEGRLGSSRLLEQIYSEFFAAWAESRAEESESLQKLRARNTGSVEELDSQTRATLRHTLVIDQLMRRLDDLSAFASIATPAQAEKFARLVQCERNPL